MIIKRTTDRNFMRWFVAIDTKNSNAIAAIMVVYRCNRRWLDQKGRVSESLHYRVNDFIVANEYQDTSAAKDLINKLVRLGVAENATHISIDVDPRDVQFFTDRGFSVRTDAISLTRMMPWLKYDKPPMPPETTVTHHSSSILAAETSESQDSSTSTSEPETPST